MDQPRWNLVVLRRKNVFLLLFVLSVFLRNKCCVYILEGKTCEEILRVGRQPSFSLPEYGVAYPCITVHLMKLRNVLTVGRVSNRRPHRSVTVLTRWLGILLTARE